jgi:ferredoxin
MASSAHIPLIQELAAQMGVAEPRVRLKPDDCILCGLCVRACKEIVGVSAISLVNRGVDKKVKPPFGGYQVGGHRGAQAGASLGFGLPGCAMPHLRGSLSKPRAPHRL